MSETNLDLLDFGADCSVVPIDQGCDYCEKMKQF